MTFIIEKSSKGEKIWDVYSKLLDERIIFISDVIHDYMATEIVAKLLYLDSISKEDIELYINSPGGIVTSGLAIYDTMQFIKSDVKTVCVGEAASMGAILLAGGTKGKRMSLPHSRIMIHQPSGGTIGTVTDMVTRVEESKNIKQIVNTILAKHTGKKIAQIEKDTDRDNFMSAEEALKYGIIDEVIK